MYRVGNRSGYAMTPIVLLYDTPFSSNCSSKCELKVHTERNTTAICSNPNNKIEQVRSTTFHYHVHVTILAMKTQQLFPFIFGAVDVAVNNKIVPFCDGNATVGSLCASVERQNTSCCC